MMGKTYMGIIRSTFLINNGILNYVWNQVKPNQQHINDVLQAI